MAPAFGLRLRIELTTANESSEKPPSGAEAHFDSDESAAQLKSCPETYSSTAEVCSEPREPFTIKVESSGADIARQIEPLCRVARLRNWRPGDRVRLHHSGGMRKVKEVLERMRVTGSGRALWPVLEVDGRIVWMKGVELEPEPGIVVVAASLEDEDAGA